LSGSTTGSEVDDGRTDGDGKVGDDLVYGLLYDLDPYDEANLDAMEGVPWAYEKHSVIASLVPSSPATTTASIVATTLDSAMAASSSTPVRSTIHTAEQIATMPKVTVLVYIDPEAGTGICIDEYMFRMNRGLRDALDLGMPKTWVRDVVGDFVPLHGDLAVIEK
jgi:gamma-glutamylcyclotransferase